MRIVFLTNSLAAGGAERVATTLCNAWAARGDTVILIPTFSGKVRSFYHLDDRITLAPISDIVQNGKTPRGYLRRFLALRELIRTNTPDVIISFLPDANVAAILGACGLNIPTIVCERTDPVVMPVSAWLSFATKLFYRFADILAVQTHEVAAKVKNIFPGVKCIKVLANPVHDDFLLPVSQHLGARKILLSLGRLIGEKQVHLIIEAFCKIHNQYPEWDLHIYGDGYAKDMLEKMVRELKIDSRVFFKGNTMEVRSVMTGADAFVMASKYEGFPNALLEAMASELPCICFDCPSGPREISDDGKYALLVPADNVTELSVAMGKLFADEALRYELGQKARASIEARYKLSVILAQWDIIFQELGITPTSVKK